MATRSAFQSYPRLRPPSKNSLEVEALLVRYPKLSEGELATLIQGFRFLPILDHAVMASDARLSEKLRAFERDHKSKLVSPGAMIAFLSLPVLLLAGTIWWLLA